MDPIERLSLPLVSYSSMVERPSISRKVVGTTPSGSSTGRRVSEGRRYDSQWFKYQSGGRRYDSVGVLGVLISEYACVIHRIKTFFKRKFIITFLICLSSLNPNLLRLLDLLRKAHLSLSKRDNILVILGSVLNKFTTAVPTTSATSWTAAYTGFGQKMSNVTSTVYVLS